MQTKTKCFLLIFRTCCVHQTGAFNTVLHKEQCYLYACVILSLPLFLSFSRRYVANTNKQNQIRNTNTNITAHPIIQHSKVGISSCINCIPIKFTAIRTSYTLHTLSIQLILFETIDVSTKWETKTQRKRERERDREWANKFLFYEPKEIENSLPIFNAPLAKWIPPHLLLHSGIQCASLKLHQRPSNR